MFLLFGEAIFEPQSALSDPYCEVKVAPNQLFQHFKLLNYSDIFSLLSLASIYAYLSIYLITSLILPSLLIYP